MSQCSFRKSIDLPALMMASSDQSAVTPPALKAKEERIVILVDKNPSDEAK
jgi:hypothetical protein